MCVCVCVCVHVCVYVCVFISLVCTQLVQLKADLQDLLYSDKWTPDAYLIARGYVSSEALDKNDDKIELTTNEK